jgi:glycerate kinase
MRVLVAPDKFRGTLTAAEAAGAIAAGWRRVRPGDEVEEVPLADGGEGTLEVLVGAYGGEERELTVHGPLGEPAPAAYGLVPREGGALAVVEMSRASGLQLVEPERRDVRRASTRGTGELILAACRDADEALVCIGGSATNDAGAGMAQALGIRLLTASGADVPPGGAALLELDAIDVGGLDPAVRRTRFLVACDVDNPLTGPEGAAAIYGPQKGATAEDVALLDRALARFAEVARRDLGVDVERLPGAGAAGGLGGGLVAFLGAELRPGVDVVMEAVGLPGRVKAADLVITGEGKLDGQSLHGKTPAGVLRLAREAGVEAAILCGRSEVRPNGVRVLSLLERFGEGPAMTQTFERLADLAGDLAAELASAPGQGAPEH